VTSIPHKNDHAKGKITIPQNKQRHWGNGAIPASERKKKMWKTCSIFVDFSSFGYDCTPFWYCSRA